MTLPLPPWPYPRWIAHRGAGKLAPENTLAAFRLGASYGWRMFECDAKLSRDGVLFLLHDTTLERTTDGHGIAGERSMGALAQLDAGRWHSRSFAGEPLPTLQAIVHFCTTNAYALNVEIKPTPGTQEATGRAVGALLARLWPQTLPPPLLTSFQPAALAGARAAAPGLPRGLLVDQWAADDSDLVRAHKLECRALALQHTLWDAALVARVHAAGLRCLSYTVNDEEAAQRLLALGMDGLMTDRVDFFSPVEAACLRG